MWKKAAEHFGIVNRSDWMLSSVCIRFVECVYGTIDVCVARCELSTRWVPYRNNGRWSILCIYQIYTPTLEQIFFSFRLILLGTIYCLSVRWKKISSQPEATPKGHTTFSHYNKAAADSFTTSNRVTYNQIIYIHLSKSISKEPEEQAKKRQQWSRRSAWERKKRRKKFTNIVIFNHEDGRRRYNSPKKSSWNQGKGKTKHNQMHTEHTMNGAAIEC